MNGGKSFYLLEKYALFPTQKTSGCKATALFKAARQTGRGKPNTQALRTSRKSSPQLGWFAVLTGMLTDASGCCKPRAFLMRTKRGKESASSSLASYLGVSCSFKGIMVSRTTHHRSKHYHLLKKPNAETEACKMWEFLMNKRQKKHVCKILGNGHT